MDAQLKELIDTIKSDGVQQAEKQAKEIVAAAEERGNETIRNAEARASKIVEEARTQQKQSEQAGREALVQAARDVILSVSAQLNSIFKSVVADAVGQAMDREVLRSTIVAVVDAWAGNQPGEIDVIVSEADKERLETSLRSSLADKIASGTEVRASQSVQNGFRIATKDGTSYFDFTAESIADAVSAYVSPRLATTVREAAHNA